MSVCFNITSGIRIVLLLWLFPCYKVIAQNLILNPENFRSYVETFNRDDHGLYFQKFPNSKAWSFLKENIPFFECPDKSLEETYYFRWWTFRKHIKESSEGYIITEFLPNVSWAGDYNSISCALGHHFYEGRWLKHTEYLQDYLRFWLNAKRKNLRAYSSWISDAWLSFLQVHPPLANQDTAILRRLSENFFAWVDHKEKETGLYWQNDGADGMEVSVGGQLSNNGVMTHGFRGIRPTLNSYLYGDALAIATLYKKTGNMAKYNLFDGISKDLRRAIDTQLWSKELAFYGSISIDNSQLYPNILPVRELIGFIPWYFNLPDDSYERGSAWNQLFDDAGFYAPYGPTTCEIRNPFFKIIYDGHECQWNGPSWPYATSQTLTAFANLLNNYHHHAMTKDKYFELLINYSQSQRRIKKNGQTLPWIDENLNPFTGDWISRSIIIEQSGINEPVYRGIKERGKDYNHSTFCDLIISGLIGVRPQLNDTLVVNSLIPDNNWDYFCLDNLFYHDQVITILYDKYGRKYNKGKGFRIYVNGIERYYSDTLTKAVIKL